MKEIFDDYIDNAFEGEYKQADFKFGQFEKNYKALFPFDKKAFLLDIGIGRGEMLSCMKNWGYENYLGIDISPSTVNFCRGLGLNCILVENTVEWLADNQQKFDLITLLDVLEHIKKNETIGFLQAVRAALKLGGTVIIQVPNLQSPDGQLHRYNDFTHEFGYIEHSLGQVLKTAGFNQFEFRGFEEIVSGGFFYKILRKLYWNFVRFSRSITGNINPAILNPVFFTIVKK
ncbi:MAG: class I SAM-dependent methyltransferase [Actinomycetota bacterium]|nr:class I SAM-dependent methyltransferase [Actinomycetota bacterium]